MPKYEYACKSCGEHIEAVQSFKDDPLTECPSCGGVLRKVFAAPGISFKGSGFYRTDNRKRRQEPKTDAKADAKADAASGSEAGPAGGSKAEPAKKEAASTTSSGSGSGSGSGADGSGSSGSSGSSSSQAKPTPKAAEAKTA